MGIIIGGLLIFLALVNLFSFAVMIIDKNLAATGRRRIGEGTLFFLAIFFGGLGVYLGMLAFHHKTRKWYFYFGIPLIMIQNLCCLAVLYHFLRTGLLFY